MSTLDPDEGLLIYTDGAFSAKSKVGGWAFVAVDINLNEYRCSGYELDTTNNRMELAAPLESLHELWTLYGPCEVEIVTDSAYVCDGITKWLANWKKNGWRTRSGQEVKNQDLWEKLEAAVKLHDFVGWRHVRGHNGHKWNEIADVDAVKARTKGEMERVDREALSDSL